MPLYQFLNQQNAQCSALCEAVDAGVFLIGVNLGTPDTQGINIDQSGSSQVIALTAEAGVTLTAAGASFPHGLDPNDRNIRIAPTFPALKDVRRAMEILTLCVELVAIRERLRQ